jgi:hypothetical protein
VGIQAIGTMVVFMTAKKIIQDFAGWAKKSQGRSLTFPGGGKYYFWIDKTFGADELEVVESTWSISLAQDYRDFLMRVGAGQFFFKEGRAKSVPKCGVELRRIDDLCVTFAASAEGPKDRIFASYLPIGIDRRERSMLILGMEPDGPVYSAKKFPEHWNELRLSEQERLGTFADWLQEIADPYSSQSPLSP